MNTVLVLAHTAKTRQKYHEALEKANYLDYRAKDATEALLSLVAFEIDTVILVDEGELHDLQVLAGVLSKRYNHKKLIMVSMNFRPDGFLVYSSTDAFLRSLT